MGHFRLLLAVLMLGTVCIQVQSIERRSTTASFKKISKLNEELDKLTAKQEELSSRFKKLDDRKAAVKKAWLAKKLRLSKLISNRIKAIDMKKVSSSAITALASVGIEITPQASKLSANKTGNKDRNSTQFDLGLLYDELFKENTKLGQLVSEIEQTQSQIRGETNPVKFAQLLKDLESKFELNQIQEYLNMSKEEIDSYKLLLDMDEAEIRKDTTQERQGQYEQLKFILPKNYKKLILEILKNVPETENINEALLKVCEYYKIQS